MATAIGQHARSMTAGGCYSFAGRVLRSRIPLPELTEVADTRQTWCSIDELSDGPLEGAPSAVGGVPFAARHRSESSLLRFVEIADFAVTLDPAQVTTHRSPGASDAQVRHTLIDQVLPRILDAQGILTVHASGVVVDHAAVLFLGQSGDGKSSLAASLSDQFTVPGDDCFLLESTDDVIEARSTYRSMRLNADSTRALLPTAAVPLGQSPELSKTQMVDPACDVGPLPVRALFILDTNHDQTESVSVEPLSARDAAVHVVRNSFRMDIHGATSLTAAFDRAEHAVRLCPVHRLSYPHDYSVLPAVHHAIFAAL